MHPILVYVRSGVVKVDFYDIFTNATQILDIPDARSPCITRSDTRKYSNSWAKIYLTYISNNCLCYRTLNQRFTQEFIHYPVVPLSDFAVLQQLSLSNDLRLRQYYLDI